MSVQAGKIRDNNSCLMPYCLRLLLLFLFVSVFPVFQPLTDTLSAQIFTPISQSSRLNCVSMPNGRARAAVQDGDTFRLMSFKRANNLTRREIQQKRNRIRNINRIMKRLNRQRRQGLSVGQLTERTLQRIYRFLVEGDIHGDFSDEIGQQIEQLQTLRDRFRAQINFHQLEIRLLRQCKRRKYFPVEIELYSFQTNVLPGHQGQPAGRITTTFIARAPLSLFTSARPSQFTTQFPTNVCLDIPGRSTPTFAVFDGYPCLRTFMDRNQRDLLIACHQYVAPRNHQGWANYKGVVMGNGSGAAPALPSRVSTFGTHANSKTMIEVMQDHEVALRQGHFAGLYSAKAAAPRRVRSLQDCAQVRF